MSLDDPNATTAQLGLAALLADARGHHIAQQTLCLLCIHFPSTIDDQTPLSTMISSTHPDEIQPEITCGPRHAIFSTESGHQRIVWFVCASISLLSARALLVEQNIHYPLQLYFNQVAAAGLLTLWPYKKRQHTRELSHESSQCRKFTTWGAVLLVASTCSISLSMLCTLQAILHFQNLPTFVMMTVRFRVSQGE
jgi:hypothetical protein